MDAGPVRGKTGWTRFDLGPVGIALDASVAFAAPFDASVVATAFTSSTDGLESTGGAGALEDCLAA